MFSGMILGPVTQMLHRFIIKQKSVFSCVFLRSNNQNEFQSLAEDVYFIDQNLYKISNYNITT